MEVKENTTYLFTKQFDIYSCQNGRCTINPGAKFTIINNRFYFLKTKNFLPIFAQDFLIKEKNVEYFKEFEILEEPIFQVNDIIFFISSICPLTEDRISSVYLEEDTFIIKYKTINGFVFDNTAIGKTIYG